MDVGILCNIGLECHRFISQIAESLFYLFLYTLSHIIKVLQIAVLMPLIYSLLNYSKNEVGIINFSLPEPTN